MIANERPNSERYCHGKTPQQTAELIRAATGWNTSVMELWLAAERAYDLAREGEQMDLASRPLRVLARLDRGRALTLPGCIFGGDNRRRRHGSRALRLT